MRTLAAIAVVVVWSVTVQSQTAGLQSGLADTITRDELRQHIYFLASDFLGGRRPDDAGFAVASEYAASQLQSAGVRPAFIGPDGAPTYFQKVPMMRVTATVDRPFTLTDLRQFQKSTTDGRGTYECRFCVVSRRSNFLNDGADGSHARRSAGGMATPQAWNTFPTVPLISLRTTYW
jgi:hypothetical protein